MSVAEIWMLHWICVHTWRYRIINDDIREKFDVTSIQKKLVQYYLRWFGYIQQRPPKASVHTAIINRFENTKRDIDQSRLTWEKIIKKDLKK
jgi:hypothetical protein